jgi:hypothetical protein
MRPPRDSVAPRGIEKSKLRRAKSEAGARKSIGEASGFTLVAVLAVLAAVGAVIYFKVLKK